MVMVPQWVILDPDLDEELDRINQEVGEQMWRKLGLKSPPSKRPAPKLDEAPPPPASGEINQ